MSTNIIQHKLTIHTCATSALVPAHDCILDDGSNDLPARATLVCPHHLPVAQLIGAMPGCQLNALLVVLQRFLDGLEERVGLVLVNAHIVADREDDFANLLLLAVFVVLLVFVETNRDVDARFSGPGLEETLVYG